MKHPKLLTALFTASALLGLVACGSGNVDVRYPTVQQLDDLDVQWGLPRRASRGNPSRTYSAPQSFSSGAAPVAGSPALPDPPLEASAQPAPRIPDQLR